jgi:hypothetical protein
MEGVSTDTKRDRRADINITHTTTHTHTRIEPCLPSWFSSTIYASKFSWKYGVRRLGKKKEKREI